MKTTGNLSQSQRWNRMMAETAMPSLSADNDNELAILCA